MLKIILLVVAMATVHGSPSLYDILDISYAPSTEMVINEGQTQIFRAALCNRNFINKWVVDVDVFLQNVQWDSGKIGDDNWLEIKVSNKADMSNIICTNEVGGSGSRMSPERRCSPFIYDRDQWGANADLYVAVTASSGTPTYQYGLNVLMTKPDRHQGINLREGTTGAVAGPAITNLPLNELEQVAIPFPSDLPVSLTGQYILPFCFDEEYDERRIQVTALVRDDVAQGAGGLATYLCTEDQVDPSGQNECFRSVVKRSGEAYYDASGAKVNALSPVISKDKFGVMYALVLAQGDYGEHISFTLTAKLRKPVQHSLSDGHATKVEKMLGCMKEKYSKKTEL